MTKKNRITYLILGVVVGLFLTACAGVVTGKIDVPGSTGVFTFGPSVQVVQAPEIQLDTVNLIPIAYEKAQLMATHKAALQEMVVEQTTVHHCNRP
ncbi:MAG: hypothetical protein HYZ49_14080 [Chloroflexi bacterium]|nr:hypothetical protein [Chloroflexota bacterium]